MNRACLIEGCRDDISGEQLFCQRHWRMMTPAIREPIIFLQNNPHSNDGLQEAIESAVEQIKARLEYPKLDPMTAWSFRRGGHG